MKKTLIALAVLAASGASFAQSSVSLTGSIGTSLQTSVKEGLSPNARQGLARSTGAIQLSGTEDLGGGMKASFRMEELVGGYQTTAARATTGTGVNTGNFGSRQAFLALSGGFGTVKAGRDLDGNSTFVSIGNISGANATVGLDGSSDNSVFYGNIRSNSVSYTTPAMMGFSAFAGISPADYATLGTRKTGKAAAGALCANAAEAAAGTCSNVIAVANSPLATSAKQDNPTAYGVTYSNGPFNAGMIVTNYEGTANTKATVYAANYDLGVARIGALLQNVTADSKENRSSSLVSLNIPMGAVALQAAYGSAKANANNAVFVDEVKHTIIGAQYNLSKRTSAYVVLNDKRVAGTTASDFDYKETAVGIKHSF